MNSSLIQAHFLIIIDTAVHSKYMVIHIQRVRYHFKLLHLYLTHVLTTLMTVFTLMGKLTCQATVVFPLVVDLIRIRLSEQLKSLLTTCLVEIMMTPSVVPVAHILAEANFLILWPIVVLIPVETSLLMLTLLVVLVISLSMMKVSLSGVLVPVETSLLMMTLLAVLVISLSMMKVSLSGVLVPVKTSLLRLGYSVCPRI